MHRIISPAALLIALEVGCARAPRPRPALRQGPVTARASASAEDRAADFGPERPTAPPSGPAAPPATAARAAPLPPSARAGERWPFHAWNRGEAVTFNHFALRPEVSLYAVNDRGWSPYLVEARPLDEAQVRRAVELIEATRGEVEISKCPFPRHAVVLYDGQTPVASINVCFECGDILLWPAWEPASDDASMSEREMKRAQGRAQAKLKLYEAVFPHWRAFFGEELGFPIEQRYE
ncbi:MAG: hypothetical protein OZ921_03480 [Sorangiineae bacterium]|nr:hypothetical protein [Polyangiaceae bacterium]MEB2321551.1 hypothetical protein [Sorangiineae bacterium]